MIAGIVQRRLPTSCARRGRPTMRPRKEMFKIFPPSVRAHHLLCVYLLVLYVHTWCAWCARARFLLVFFDKQPKSSRTPAPERLCFAPKIDHVDSSRDLGLPKFGVRLKNYELAGMGFAFLRGEQPFYKKNNFSEFSDSPERPSGGPKIAVPADIALFRPHRQQ